MPEMRIRIVAMVSHVVAFSGFCVLMAAWVLRGGNGGGGVLAYGAFAWVLAITAGLNVTLRCPRCRRRIYKDRELMFPTPRTCSACGADL